MCEKKQQRKRKNRTRGQEKKKQIGRFVAAKTVYCLKMGQISQYVVQTVGQDARASLIERGSEEELLV